MSSKVLFIVVALSALFCVRSETSVGNSGLRSPSLLLPSSPSHLLAKRSFDVECKGVYDTGIFAKLNRVCKDCQNLYRDEPSVYGKCRSGCFGSDMFLECVMNLALPIMPHFIDAQIIREM